jgi:hypothetical protein
VAAQEAVEDLTPTIVAVVVVQAGLWKKPSIWTRIKQSPLGQVRRKTRRGLVHPSVDCVESQLLVVVTVLMSLIFNRVLVRLVAVVRAETQRLAVHRSTTR